MLAALALVGNYPAAVFCIFGASYLATQSSITVSNQSGARLDQVTLVDPLGKTTNIGPLGTSEVVSKTYYPRGEGGVRLRVAAGNLRKEEIIVGYLSGNEGVTTEATVGQDLEITSSSSNR